ncbi:alpha/beta hydrolase, partial [Fibrobacterota bacterium]
GWTSSPRELRFLAESLKDSYHCRGILLEGHGLNLEALENTSWERHLSQVMEALTELEKRFEKITVIGLSYGAVLALHAAARKQFHGLILLSPFIRSAASLIKGVSNSFYIQFLPSFVKNLGKGNSGPINDRAEGEKHIAYHKMPVKPLKSMLKGIKKAIPLLPMIKCPVLLMHSRGDQTAHYQGSVRILEGLGSRDKSLVTLIRSNHIITLDYERERVEGEVARWLSEHN